MRLNASLLVKASGMTLVLVVVGLLHSTSHQALNTDLGTDTLSLVTPLLQPPPLSAQSPTTATASVASVDALLAHSSRQSGGDSNETLNRRFSVAESLDRVKQLEWALANFRTATTPQQTQPGNQAMAVNDRSHSGTQQRAHNWAGGVTGTLKKQDYEIKKLELALAQKQYKDGEIPKAALMQKQASYQKSALEFKTFLNSFRIAD